MEFLCFQFIYCVEVILDLHLWLLLFLPSLLCACTGIYFWIFLVFGFEQVWLIVCVGVVAFSHDRKFLGSIAHDQMLKVFFFLIFAKNCESCLHCCLNCVSFILGAHFLIVTYRSTNHIREACKKSARAENERSKLEISKGESENENSESDLKVYKDILSFSLLICL